MALQDGRSTRHGWVTRRLRAGAKGLAAILALALLTLAAAACSTSTSSTVKLHNQGRGGSNLFWNTAGTGGASSAIAWAESFMFGQPNAAVAVNYSGYCLAFVANAYGSQYAYYDTAWQQAQASNLKDPNNPSAAPRGALMFFDLSGKHPPVPEGHVGISLGNGSMLSALEHSPYVQVTPGIQSDTYWSPAYRGWAWPPANWGPLAKQAATYTSGTEGHPPQVDLQQGSFVGNNYYYLISITSFAPNTSVLVTCYDSLRTGGFHSFSLLTDKYGIASSFDKCISGKGTDHWVVAGGIGSNHVFWKQGSDPICCGQSSGPPTVTPTTPITYPPTVTPTTTPTPLPPLPHYYETTGGVTHTWSNYMNAGGTQGQSIPAYTTVQIACKLTGFKVADGNTWWYRIASSPWNGQYYASADAFYNNGQTSGSLNGTPWVDSNVPDC